MATAKGNTPIKVMNTGRILKVLMFQGDTSRAEIARQTGLSAPTVTRIVAELLESGLVLDKGTVQLQDRGTPPNLLSFNARIGYLMGIYVGEITIQFLLTDLLGETIDNMELPNMEKIGGDTTVKQIVKGYYSLLEKHDLDTELLWQVCVGVSGTTVTNGINGVINVPDIEGWLKFPLLEKLIAELGTENIQIENADNLAVICEHRLGSAKDYTDVVLINIKSSIGAGVIINNQLYTGYSGVAGEVGFMLPSTYDTPPKASPTKARHGALEMKIGLTALLQQLNIRLEDLDTPKRTPYLEQLIAMALNGDKEIIGTLRESFKYVAQAAVNVCSVLNPQLLILGGDIMPVGDLLLDIVKEYLNDFCLKAPEAKLSVHGSRASVLGAVQVACDKICQRLAIW
jgi:predicted NBD/HSP70 family sugar kinase